ncbi:MAG: M17 family peptidase N-terminal domain-containing protein, partial [Solirubrobacteraceae bacterium]
MNVSFTALAPQETDADTVAIGVFEGDEAPAGAPTEVGELLANGEAKRSPKALALTHADGKRWLVVGLGKREDFTPERARVAAALVRDRAKELSTKALCWQAPTDDPAVAGALVEGTVLADYSFDSHKSKGKESDTPPKHLDRLIVSGADDLAQAVDRAGVVATAVNEARDLQNRPANDLTPTALGKHALGLAEEIEHLSV